MSLSPLSLSRISNQFRGNLINSQIGNTQRLIADVQQELTTGKRLSTPSKDAGDAAVAQQVRRLLEQREAWLSNLRASNDQLGLVDTSLGSLEEQLRDAATTASRTVGSEVSESERSASADVIDSIFSQVLTLANKSLSGVYLFAGDRSTSAPFVEAAGGVQWVGSDRLLANEVDEKTSLTFMADGAEVFGARSTRVQGRADLSPEASADTLLRDLRGASGAGVRQGVIRINDGTQSVDIDLSTADTLGDVVDLINAAGLTGVTASVNTGTGAIDLAVAPGSDVTVTDVGGQTTARDLGLLTTSPGGDGVDVAGAALAPRLSLLTPLAQLRAGAGVDNSGLTITNGSATATIDFVGATTVEDLINRINNSGTFVEARINAAGTGIDIVNTVQGTELRVAENGGFSASQLGVRSFDTATPIELINSGKGLKQVVGPELRVTDSAGVSFEVDFDGAETAQEVIDAINNAATLAGAQVAASFADATNGFVLTDTAGGGGTMTLANLNFSTAVNDLGLTGAVSGGVLVGTDVAPIKSEGIFGSLDRLRRAMRANDQQAMTIAAAELDEHLQRVTKVRGANGAKVQEFEARIESIQDQNVATNSLLSELEDSDYTEAIIRFQTLQTALQASMQSASTTLNLSLMDYL